MEPYEDLESRYAGKLSPLDIHYLSAKYYGLRDPLTKNGRPTFNMIDDHALYHVTFGTSEGVSPYSINEQTLLYDENPLPFQVYLVERCVPTVGRYYYFRHPDYCTPTLDNQLILNVTFIRQCFCCDFCQYRLYKSQPNISPEEGFRQIIGRGDHADLSQVSQIAIVTGLLGTSEKALDHVERVIDCAAGYGFKGSIFYMGFEIGTPYLVEKLVKKVKAAGLVGLRLAYTIEMFSNRSRLMHGKKSHKNIKDLAEHLRSLSEAGIDQLEYTYIPGLDEMEQFKQGAELLNPYAKPHICIFRPWKPGQRAEQISGEYARMGPRFLCEMRLFYEELMGGPLYGNQLANLWPFPEGRFNPGWRTWELEGPDEFIRYWKGRTDPRQRCRKAGCEQECQIFNETGCCRYPARLV